MFLSNSGSSNPIDNMLSTELGDILSGPFLSTIILMILVLILVIAINISSKKALKDPLKTPKGLFYIWILFVQWIERIVTDVMGDRNRNFAGIIIAISMYLFFVPVLMADSGKRLSQLLYELTAAGTVADSHGFPF